MVRLFVGGLPPDVTEEALVQRFTPFGQVPACEIIPSKEPGEQQQGPTVASQPACRGFAYVELNPRDDAALGRCLSLYNHSKWRGHVLRVEVARQHYMAKLQQECEAEAAGTWVPPSRKRRQNESSTEVPDEPWNGIPQPLNTQEPLQLVLGYKRRRAKVMVVPLDTASTAKNVKHQFPAASTLPLDHLSWEYDETPLNRHIQHLNELWHMRCTTYQPTSTTHDTTQRGTNDMTAVQMDYDVPNTVPKAQTDVAKMPLDTATQAKVATVKSQEHQAYLKILKSINTASQKEEAAAASAAAAARGVQRARQQAKASKSGGKHQLAPLVAPTAAVPADANMASVVTFLDEDADVEDVGAPADLDRFGSDTESEGYRPARQQAGSRRGVQQGSIPPEDKPQEAAKVHSEQRPNLSAQLQGRAHAAPEGNPQPQEVQSVQDGGMESEEQQGSPVPGGLVQELSEDDASLDVHDSPPSEVSDEDQDMDMNDQPFLSSEEDLSGEDEQGAVRCGGIPDDLTAEADGLEEDGGMSSDSDSKAAGEAISEEEEVKEPEVHKVHAPALPATNQGACHMQQASRQKVPPASGPAVSKRLHHVETLVPVRQQQAQGRGAGVISFEDDSDSDEVFHDIDDSDNEQQKQKPRATGTAKSAATGASTRPPAGAVTARVGAQQAWQQRVSLQKEDLQGPPRPQHRQTAAVQQASDKDTQQEQLQALQGRLCKGELGQQPYRKPQLAPALAVAQPAVAPGKQKTPATASAKPEKQQQQQQPAPAATAVEPATASHAAVAPTPASPAAQPPAAGKQLPFTFNFLTDEDGADMTPAAAAAPERQEAVTRTPGHKRAGDALGRKASDVAAVAHTHVKSSRKVASAPTTPVAAPSSSTPGAAAIPKVQSAAPKLKLPAGLQYAATFMRTKSLEEVQAQWAVQRAQLVTDSNKKQRKKGMSKH